MSREIDERVVQMQFENGVFEKNIQTSIHSLNELKKGLDLDGATKGLEKVDKAAQSVKMDALSAAVEKVSSKFTLLGITAFNVMNRISNAAINTGEALIKSLSTDQISAGFGKYEQKTSAVQTIMSATANQFANTGEQMAYVNEQLDKLNWFTDETSYNFVDMVSNIGKFTANNIPLEEAVTSMQGIANWAALSGANAEQASHSMYNLAQALSSGSVKLMDWKSVELMNMGTAQFKDEAIEAAVAAGTLTRGLDGVARTVKGTEVTTTTFNTTLSESWFTTKVLVDVLNKYGGAANRLNALFNETGIASSVLVDGIKAYTNGSKTAEQVSEDWGLELEKTKGILKEFSTETMQFGIKAFDAAQEARTFGDAIDATKDAVSTGWLKSFELIFGDYTQAKELWTELSNQLYDIFAGGTKARNDMLKAWQDAGGRDTFVDTIWASLSAILRILGPIKFAWEDTFGTLTSDRLLKITNAVHDFVVSLNLSGEQMEKLRATFRGLFSVLDIFLTILNGGFKIGLNAIRAILKELNTDFLGFTGGIGDNITAVRNWIKETGTIEEVVDIISSAIEGAVHSAGNFVRGIKDMKVVKALSASFSKAFTSDFKGISSVLEFVKLTVKSLFSYLQNIPKIRSFSDITSGLNDFAASVAENLEKVGFSFEGFHATFEYGFDGIIGIIGTFLKELTEAGIAAGGIFASIAEAMGQIDWAGVTLLAGGITVIALLWKFASALQTVAEAIENFGGVFGSLKGMFDSIGGYFKALKKNMAVNNVLKVAVAFGILAASLSLLAHLDLGAVIASGVVLGVLIGGLMGLIVVVNKFGSPGDEAKSITGLVAIAAAIGILALALNSIRVDDTIGQRLVIIGGALAAMFAIMKFSGGKDAKNLANASSILALAAGVYIIAKALNSLKKLTAEDIGKVIPVLAIIVIALKSLLKVITGGVVLKKDETLKAATNVLSILAVVLALKTVVSAIKQLGKMDPQVLYSGLIALLPIFIELGLLFAATKLAGENAMKAGGLILFVGVGLKLMAGAIKSLGGISDSVIDRGLSVINRISLVYAALIAVSKLAGENANKVGVMLLGMAASLAIIQLVIKTLGKTDFLTLVKGVGAVTAVMLAFVPLIKATSGERSSEMTKSLTKMAIIIGLLGVVIAALSYIEPGKLIASTASISAALLSLAGFFKIANDMKSPKTSDLIKMVAVIGIISVILGSLAGMADPKSALAVATGMSEILLAVAAAGVIMGKTKMPNADDAKAMGIFVIAVGGIMAALAFTVGYINKAGGSVDGVLKLTTGMSEILLAVGLSVKVMNKADKPNMGNVGVLSAFVGAVGLIIAALAGVMGYINSVGGSIDGVLQLTTGMSEILLSLAVAARILGSNGNVKTPNAGTMTAFTAMVAGIGGVIALFSSWSDPAKVIPYATSMSEVMLALAVTMKIVSTINNDISGWNVGMFAIVTALTAAMGAVLAGLSNMVNPDSVLPIATGMSGVMLAIAGVVKILSKTEPLVFTGAFEGLKMMGIIVAALGGLAIALGALYQIPFFQDALNDSGAAMTAFGKAIGGFFGGIVGGFVGGAIEGVLDIIPMVGKKLTEFMTAAMPGFMLMKASSGILKAAGEVSAAILLFTAADFISGIGGFLGSILGQKDNGLSDRFKNFGEAITAFSDAIGPDFDPKKVTAAAEAAKALGELENNLPAQGGVLQDWLGSKTLDTFGERLKKFGTAIAEFSASITGWGGESIINKKAVQAAADAGTMLAKLEESIPAQGGALQKFLGSKTLDTFGERLKKFGTAIVDFSNEVTGENGKSSVNKKAVDAARDAGEMLAKLEEKIPAQDGMLQAFLGSKSLDDFGNRLGLLGDGIKAFSDAVTLEGGIDTEAIGKATTAIGDLVDLESRVDTSGGLGWIFSGSSDFKSFGSNLEALGGSLSTYGEKIKDVDVSKIIRMNTALTGLMDATTSAKDSSANLISLGSNLRSFATNVSFYATTAMNANTDAMAKVKAAIEDLLRLSEFTDAQQWLNDIISMSKRMIVQLQVSVALQHSKIRDSGKGLAYWFVQGFKMGIEENSNDAKNAAISLATSVDEAVKDTLVIASPSAVMAEEGKWVVRGLAEGITNDTSAEEAASKKAQNVVNAFQEVLSTISAKSQRADLEYQLWEQTEGYGASDADKNTKQLQVKTQQLQYSADQVKAQKATLEALKKTVGESSKEYNDAYNTYLQDMISMYQKKHEIDEITAVAEKDDRQKMIDYANTRKEYAEAFKMLGWSELEQQAFAMQKSGWGTGQEVGYTTDQLKQDLIDTNAIIAGALADQSVSIEQSVTQTASNAVKKGLANAAPAAKEAGTNLTAGLNEGIKEGSSSTKETVRGVGGQLLDEWWTIFEEHSPSRVTHQMGWYLTEGLANGIADPEVNSMVTQSSVHVSENSLQPLQSSLPQYEYIGRQAMTGFKKGIEIVGRQAIQAAQRIAAQVAATMEVALSVHSPSKVTEQIGKYVSLGLANGILDGEPQVTNASDKVAKSTLMVLDDAKHRIYDALQSDDAFSPTITPVLDMDTFRHQAKGISGLLGSGNTLQVGSIKARVGTIAAEQNGFRQNGSARFGTTNYSFTQNNYSPKSLSRIDIYRDTKNQFSQLKNLASKR